MISKEAMIAKINATVPEEAMADLDKALGECVDDHGNIWFNLNEFGFINTFPCFSGWKIKPEVENSCTSYIALSVCMQAAIVDVLYIY